MSTWLFALQLIPLIIHLMTVAEKLLGPGTGVQKKAFVKDGIQQTINAIATVSTGGQKNTWESVELFITPISQLIDVLTALLFPHKE